MSFNRPLNQQNIEESILPEGEHTVKIISSEECVSQNTGKDMIRLKLKVQNAKFPNLTISYFIVDDEHADAKVVKIFHSCGKQPPAIIAPNIFVGLVGVVRTRNKPYNGEMSPEVYYWVKPPIDAQLEPATFPTEKNPDNSADNIPF